MQSPSLTELGAAPVINYKMGLSLDKVNYYAEECIRKNNKDYNGLV